MAYAPRPCKNCGEPTTNPTFCSRSCSASFNNKLDPMRGPKKNPPKCCIDCGAEVSKNSKRSERCRSCSLKERTAEVGRRTKGEMLIMEASRGAMRNRYNNIRMHGHSKCKAEGWHQTACECCGYDKVVQLCHITPIPDFPDDTKLDEINGRENVLFLCPNCHWELDHGIDPREQGRRESNPHETV